MVKRRGSMPEQDLVGIVERASTLYERPGGDFVPAEGEDAALVDERLEAWSWALGKGDQDFPLRPRWRLASLKIGSSSISHPLAGHVKSNFLQAVANVLSWPSSAKRHRRS